jgi:hypothetical protein
MRHGSGKSGRNDIVEPLFGRCPAHLGPSGGPHLIARIDLCCDPYPTCNDLDMCSFYVSEKSVSRY